MISINFNPDFRLCILLVSMILSTAEYSTFGYLSLTAGFDHLEFGMVGTNE
jgi:hypothetical protein